MSEYTITKAQLNAFKRVWPCHDIPDKLSGVRFKYAANYDVVAWDLVAIDYISAEDITPDEEEEMGAAITALSQDAQWLMTGGSVSWWSE